MRMLTCMSAPSSILLEFYRHLVSSDCGHPAVQQPPILTQICVSGGLIMPKNPIIFPAGDIM